MFKLSENEWVVLCALWQGESFSLGEVFNEVNKSIAWSKNTVYTYLIRMQVKGLVAIDKASKKPYSALVSKQECANEQCETLVNTVYDGSASRLVSAFLKGTTITAQEKDELLNLIENMEV
ncbi:MAG: BlaI/MecI/CopY family transcriptional regulator [Clostridia bacterium]